VHRPTAARYSYDWKQCENDTGKVPGGSSVAAKDDRDRAEVTLSAVYTHYRADTYVKLYCHNLVHRNITR